MRLRLKDFYTLNSIAIYTALIAAIILFPNFFSFNVSPLNEANHFSKSLDISWMVTQNFANYKNLIWGKDFVFTYGPLSSLGLRIPWGESKINFILFDIFYIVNIFSLVYVSIKKNSNKIFTFLSLIVIVLLLSTIFGGDYAIIYFFILLFWVFKSIETPKTIYFAFQLLIVTLLFYLKFNTGLVSLLIFYAAILFQLYHRKLPFLKLAIYSIIPVLLIFISAELLNVELYTYITNGFEMVKGYNETMYFQTELFSSHIYWVILFFICSTALLVFTLYSRKRSS